MQNKLEKDLKTTKRSLKLLKDNNDKLEKELRDNWYLIVPLTVSQRDGYSDIEKKQINYSQLMLDIDKLHLINNNKHQNIQWKTPIEDTIY